MRGIYENDHAYLKALQHKTYPQYISLVGRGSMKIFLALCDNVYIINTLRPVANFLEMNDDAYIILNRLK